MLEVEFKALSPLFAGPNRPFGIVGTCQVRPLELGAPAEKLSFV